MLLGEYIASPKEDKVLGLGVVYPSYDEIAQSIAKRDKARIAPAGCVCDERIGLNDTSSYESCISY